MDNSHPETRKLTVAAGYFMFKNEQHFRTRDLKIFQKNPPYLAVLSLKMKKLLLFFVLTTIHAYGQSNLEAELPGTWTVVEVSQIYAPADPVKIEQAKDIIRSLRFEFRADHYVHVDASDIVLSIPDGYWETKGNEVRIGRWSEKNSRANLVQLAVQQRDGRWYFVLEQIAEVEVRKE
jgi:hypothetical protein